MKDVKVGLRIWFASGYAIEGDPETLSQDQLKAKLVDTRDAVGRLDGVFQVETNGNYSIIPSRVVQMVELFVVDDEEA